MQEGAIVLLLSPKSVPCSVRVQVTRWQETMVRRVFSRRGVGREERVIVNRAEYLGVGVANSRVWPMDNKCQGESQRGWRTEGEGRATDSSQIGLRLIAAGKIFFFGIFSR